MPSLLATASLTDCFIGSPLFDPIKRYFMRQATHWWTEIALLVFEADQINLLLWIIFEMPGIEQHAHRARLSKDFIFSRIWYRSIVGDGRGGINRIALL